MARTQTTVRIRRPAAVVFDAIERHGRVNDPAWEPEVLAVEPLATGPLRVGSRVAMTRRDGGRTHTTTYEVTAFDPPRRLAIRHVDGPMDFALEFRVEPVTDAETDVTATVDMSPRGKLRVLAPVFALMGPRERAHLGRDGQGDRGVDRGGAGRAGARARLTYATSRLYRIRRG